MSHPSTGGWLEVHASKYSIRPSASRTSYCQLEIDTDITGVQAHEPVGDWLKMAPIRVLSFDIECAGRKGVFPKPEIDPVIQIANVVSLQGSLDEPIIRNVFTLNTCAPIVGAQVISNATEEEMLMKWVEFFVHVSRGSCWMMRFTRGLATHVAAYVDVSHSHPSLSLSSVIPTSSPATTSATSISPTCWIVPRR